MRMPALILAVLVASCAGGCTQLLAGGLVAGQALIPISEEDELAIGRSAAAEVLADPATPEYTQAGVTGYVAAIGKQVAAKGDRPTLGYTFRVLQTEELNAFALPGGQVFVTTGALKAMTDEAQLAGVLGHELAHTARRHGLDQLKRAMVAEGIVIAALGSTPKLAQQAGSLALQLVLKGYGREAENEADYYGLIYAHGAGYDPRGLGTFLGTVAAKYGDTPKILEPLSDHPATADRIAKLHETIDRQRLRGGTTGASTYLAATAPLR